MKPYTDAGFEDVVSPGINNWSRVYPNYTMALRLREHPAVHARDGQS